MGNLRVSVVMCTYNGEKWISKQLETILAQSYPVYEILIQDDMSSDSTREIILRYAQNHPNIHLIQNSQQLGPHKNFMNAIPKATGDYIAISDQDDIWEMNKIEKLVTAIQGHSMSFGLSQSFGDNAEFDSEIRIPNVNTLRLLFYPVIPGHSMLFRRDVFQKIPANCSSQAYDLLIALSACIHGTVSVVPEILTLHRRHLNAYSYSPPKNYSKSLINVTRYLFSGILGYFKKKKKIKLHFSKMNELLMEFAVSNDNSTNGSALKFSSYMSKGDLISIIKASNICYKNRKQIFYAQTKDNLLLKVRAILCPMLCSEYY